LPGVETRRTFCRPMRRISSAHHSAHRLTSAACSGSALMLGIARNAFSSSRYRSRLTLTKSMTLSTEPPSIVVFDGAIVGLQLLDMGAHVLARGAHQRRAQAIFDNLRDLLPGRAAVRQPIPHLLFLHLAVAVHTVQGHGVLRL